MAESSPSNRDTSPPRTIGGIIPVMLTPFREDGSVDLEALDRLTDWYLDQGADALFAVCQSSEMQFLTLEEKTAIAARVVKRVGGRVPVVASGHTSEALEAQYHELASIAETGVDAIILVTSRLDPENEGELAFRGRWTGFCPACRATCRSDFTNAPGRTAGFSPMRSWSAAARSGRFVALKDVSCDLGVVKRRLNLVADTPLGGHQRQCRDRL